MIEVIMEYIYNSITIVAMVEKNIVAFLFCDCSFLPIHCLMKAYTTSTLLYCVLSSKPECAQSTNCVCIIQQVLY